MALLDDIRVKIAARQYEFSKHAVDQTIIRGIGVAELEEAISSRSEVIEDYPEDKLWNRRSHSKHRWPNTMPSNVPKVRIVSRRKNHREPFSA